MMVLRLYWKDKDNNTYSLGDLYKKDEKYYFDIVEDDELKKAIKAGCYGIGEINLFYKNHISDNLFSFFKRRIPSNDHPEIKEILEELQIKEYDEMLLLKLTNGILNTDRYYLEEV